MSEESENSNKNTTTVRGNTYFKVTEIILASFSYIITFQYQTFIFFLLNLLDLLAANSS